MSLTRLAAFALLAGFAASCSPVAVADPNSPAAVPAPPATAAPLAAAPAPVPTPAAPPAAPLPRSAMPAGPVTLRYKLSPGQVIRYHVLDTLKGVYKFGARAVPMDARSTTDLAVTVLLVDSGTGDATLKISAHVVSRRVINGKIDSSNKPADYSLQMVVSPNGASKSVKLPQDLKTALGYFDLNRPSSFSSIYFVQSAPFPARPVKIADAWTRADPPGQPGLVQRDIESLQSLDTIDGHAVARIALRADATMHVAVALSGESKMQMTLRMNITGSQVFDRDAGVVASDTQTNAIQGTIKMAAGDSLGSLPLTCRFTETRTTRRVEPDPEAITL